MGYRYRKSIKFPGGFRVNISKSGVGYSWGSKWRRITKTAKGTIRNTTTIPGTGISYVTESKASNAPIEKSGKNGSDKINPIVYVLWFCGIAFAVFFLLRLIF